MIGSTLPAYVILGGGVGGKGSDGQIVIVY